MSTRKLSLPNLLSFLRGWTSTGRVQRLDRRARLKQTSPLPSFDFACAAELHAAAIEAAPVASREELSVIGPILAQCALGTTTRHWLDSLRRALLISGVDSRTRACAAIVSRWPEFDIAVRSRVLTGFPGSWPRVFEALAADPSPRARLALAQCLLELDRDEFLSFSVDLLSDPEAGTIAQRTLTQAATRAANSGLSGGVVEDELLRAACGFAVHQRRGVMAALAMLLSSVDRDGRLWRWVRAGEPEVGALQSAIRTTEGPQMRSKAWELMTSPELSRAAIDRLGRARETGEHEVVLGAWHLAAHPARLRTVRQVGGTAGEQGASWSGLPTLAQLARLSAPARRGAVRFATLSGASHRLLDDYVGALLSDADPRVRYAAAREIPADLLVDLTFDRDARVATTTALRLAGTSSVAHAASWASLDRSPHQRVRSIATSRPRAALDAWLTPWDPTSRVWLRHALAFDRSHALEGARSLWGRCQPSQRLQIARTIRALGLGGALADLLIPAAQAGSRAKGDTTILRSASAAATALGDAGAELAGATLRQCLEAGDGRLRSNALEALVRIRRQEPMVLARDAVIELKNDPHHRVRASAIRAMTLLDDDATTLTAAIAGEATSRMLDDIRPMHRLAGVWLAERLMGVGGLIRGAQGTSRAVDLLRRCAAGDIEPRVQTRATACLELMDVTHDDQPDRTALEAA